MRLFDIRIAGRGEAANSVYIYHGFLVGCHIKEIFQQFKEFFEANPKEFVLIAVISEFGRSLNAG